MIYNKLIVPVTRILSSREAYKYTFKRFDILSQKISATKKARPRKCKLLNNLKMLYHYEAKKKNYTS